MRFSCDTGISQTKVNLTETGAQRLRVRCPTSCSALLYQQVSQVHIQAQHQIVAALKLFTSFIIISVLRGLHGLQGGSRGHLESSRGHWGCVEDLLKDLEVPEEFHIEIQGVIEEVSGLQEGSGGV